jgi:anti-anti-sigma regulatory factor
MVFSGQYDVSCKQRWSEQLESLCSEPNVIIDLSDVTSLDATCVTEILKMHARRDAKGFDRETVILVDPGVRRLFDLLKMQDVVRVVESLDDAVRKRRSPPVVHFAFRGEVRPSRTLARTSAPPISLAISPSRSI